MKKPIVVVDLFCGMGGFTQGAIDAGADVILSVDAWDEACDVHEKNHPGVRIDCIQLGNPEWYKGLLRFLEPYRRTHHIHLHGSPPCQALSNASSRNAEEGMPLVIWFLNLVKSVQPDSWSMENVIPVRKRLPEGTPSVTLNSADFGVPQTRRRCYAGSGWVAEPTHAKEGSPFSPNQEKILWKWVSVIEALPHLIDLMPVPSMTEQYKTASKNKPYPTVTSHSPKQLRLVMDSGRASAASTGISKDGKKAGGSGPLFRDLDQPSYTQMTSARRLMFRTDEPKKIRSLTLEETLTLQGFSPDYDLSPARTMKSRWTMVGNAVPPPVAEAVIRGIQQ